MSDRIVLADMRFQGRHGWYEHERKTPQRFEVDVELELDLRPAGFDDELERTIDYGKVYEAVREIVESRTFKLLETIAQTIADAILADHDVRAVTVRVRKPDVQLGGPLAYAGVEIRRDRSVPEGGA